LRVKPPNEVAARSHTELHPVFKRVLVSLLLIGVGHPQDAEIVDYH
jgi:hypothetical protein